MGVGKDDVAEYGIKKEARGKAEAAWPVNSPPPKSNITYIEINLYAKTHRYSSQNSHKECALILIASDKKRAKATSHLRRIQDGQPARSAVQPERRCATPTPTSAQGGKNISDNCIDRKRRLLEARLPTKHDIPIAVRPRTALPPLRAEEKAASRTAKKANAQSG